MIVADAEYISVVIIVRLNNSVVAMIEVMFFIDVEIIDIGIISDDVSVDT